MKHLSLLLLLLTTSAWGQTGIIPQPAVNKAQRGSFIVRPGLRLWAAPACVAERAFLTEYWREARLPDLTSVTKSRSADVILQVDTARREALGPEGYELLISPRRISLTGATATGVFYGLQTLRQALATATVKPDSADRLAMAALLVRDKPRFGWRSFTLRENRTTGDIVAVKKLIDQLVFLKFNRLHWTLPPPVQSGVPIYTPEQIQVIRQYAQARHMALAVEASPPPLTDQKPGRVSYDYHPTAQTTISFWEGDHKSLLEAVRGGREVVIATRRETYLNLPANDLPLERAYRFEPIPEQMPVDLSPNILGVNYTFDEGDVVAPDPLSVVLFPRLMAAAEVAWTFQQHKDWPRFRERLARFNNRWVKP